jgi:hypothetical protein
MDMVYEVVSDHSLTSFAHERLSQCHEGWSIELSYVYGIIEGISR